MYGHEKADIITIQVTGNGFLYNMVRIIAGTLIKVGAGEFAPQEMQTILDACDRVWQDRRLLHTD